MTGGHSQVVRDGAVRPSPGTARVDVCRPEPPYTSPWSRRGATATRRSRGALASPFALLLACLPGDALACATCALREPESAVRSVLLVVGLMLAPFLVVGVGVWAVRRLAREELP